MLFVTKTLLENELTPYFVKNKAVGFVPTMGALHQGHLSLVEMALSENDIVVVSIFVNPTQFDQTKDLKKYPRTLEADLGLLHTLSQNVLVYAPSPDEVYGSTVIAKAYNFGGLENVMEGKYRKGHFNGVGSVLSLLFKSVNPTRAYFGEKDFQQLQIVKKLVEIEKLPVKIIGCPIKREANGLAMSSRNKRLKKKEFEGAGIIFETLINAADMFDSKSINTIKAYVIEVFKNHPLFILEYFEIADSKTLTPANRKFKNKNYRAFIAVFAGEVRLIDNIALS